MRQATARGSNRRLGGAVVGLALLAMLLFVALRVSDATGAEGDGCGVGACVILIQVDGLEPKDVNEETTPYVWRLAHPRARGQNLPTPALTQRAGFIWQAPRGVVSSGTASATASLLTGAFPQYTNVPADDFYGKEDNAGFVRQRLSAGGFGDTTHPNTGFDRALPVEAPAVDTLPGIVRAADSEAAIFLGDPGLADLTEATTQGSPHWFPPGTEGSASVPEGQYTGDPRLCPIPRHAGGGGSIPNEQPDPENYHPEQCPANDLTTMNKAASDLTKPANSGVGFTFIHLAEVGAAKRLAGDTDADGVPTTQPPSPGQALADMDEAIATFVEQYAQSNPAKWQKTVLMITGTHGYQRTPLISRVPDPDPENVSIPTRDLSDYVAEYTRNGVDEGALTLVQQGTMGTIYYGATGKGSPADRAAALESIKGDLEERLNAACNERVRGGEVVEGENPGDCLEGIYYVDKALAGDEPTIDEAHPTWRLDARDPDTGVRTGASGDLVILLKRGWAFGRAVGVPGISTAQSSQPVVNPYTASSGGPQERAVATIVNGTNQAGMTWAVRDLDTFGGSQTGGSAVDYYPVSNGSVDPSDPDNPPGVGNAKCPDTPTDPGGLTCANRPEEVGDDAEDPGHEAQPVTVDIAYTVAALMQLGFESYPQQLQGRVLQEAFVNKIDIPKDEEEPVVEEPEPEPPALPPPPPPQVEAPEGFNFHGLIRDLRARVVDSSGDTYARARRGSRLSTIRLEADFGRPETAVTLTFYRRTTSRNASRRTRGRRSGVVRLRAIARFDPFVVKRGEVTMRLKIPVQFRPTHIGLHVREIARTASGRRATTGAEPCTTVKTREPVRFRCTGPTRGAIVSIRDANRLHKSKGPARRRSGRGR